jgi:cell division topological specificity factor
MSILDYLRRKTSNKTASIAKERLQIIISHERAERNTPDYLPQLQEELLAVIAKYIPIDPNEVKVNLARMENNSAILELNFTMPEEEVV